jgi:uncharacterized protein YqjF (DUF2071 family)
MHEADKTPTTLRSWVWSQHWQDVLFLHWRVAPHALASRVPDPLEVDTYEGDAWVSLVLFRLRVRPRWLPFLPGVSDLIEANLRTYVRCHGKPGIWFLSVHADNAWAIRWATLLTPMPYALAALRYRNVGRQFDFEAWDASSTRQLAALSFSPIETPTETPTALNERLLGEWLLERYRLFAPGRGGLLQADVAHRPWSIQGAAVSGSPAGFGAAVGLDLPDVPERVHFSPGVPARFGAFERLQEPEPPRFQGCVQRASR